MSAVNSPVPKMQFFTSNGAPAVGYKLFTYVAGTTTKQATYTDFGGGSPNTNPIILDYRGECNLWIPPNVKYKYVLATAADTDPPTNPIWPVDNIVNSQLVTLYGGVDSGTANAYVLNFTANYSAYADGIVIYFIPTNTNTSASTINVNGLGIVSIKNYDGSSLASNQIIANSVTGILYKGGQFILFTSPLSVTAYSGSFTPTWFGLTANPSGTMYYQVTGNLVTLEWVGALGVSNATSLSILNLPTNLKPSSVSGLAAGGTVPVMVVDAGVAKLGSLRFSGLSSMNFSVGATPSETGFTAAGSKGLDNGWTVTYMNK